MKNDTIGVALIGCGGIALANHYRGLRFCKDARLVALCDSNEEALQRASRESDIEATFTNYEDAINHPEVDAVIVATPNAIHAPASLAAIQAGKHVLCEKPLAMNMDECLRMLNAARAANVRHMTAFTYRFVPAMQYMAHRVGSGFIGTPFHFRSLRQQDWGTRNLGWRQIKKLASTGELGDMLSHRIDFAHVLFGNIQSVAGDIRRFHDDREGHPSDLEDWVGVIARFDNNATGTLESTKVATGHGEGGHSQDYCEVTGSEGSLVYLLERPNEIRIGRPGQPGLTTEPVPQEFLKVNGSPRDPSEGDPLQVFRYDQNFVWVEAIREGRDCEPSFADGVRAQAVMNAVMQSIDERKWVDVKYP